MNLYNCNKYSSSPDKQYEEVQVELKDSLFAPYVSLHKLTTDNFDKI